MHAGAPAARLGDDAGVRYALGRAVPGWPQKLHTARWRQLSGVGLLESRESSEWIASIFGCATWGALATQPSINAALLCDSSMGQVGHCEVASLRMRRHNTVGHPFQTDALFLWYVERGALAVDLDDGDCVRYGPGALLLSDGAQALRAHWSHASVHHLRVPRHRLIEVVGHAGAAALQGVMNLGELGLASLLGAQLQLLHKQGPCMPVAELDETLSLVFGTADSLFRLALPPRQALPPPEVTDKLQAVYRYIEKNLHRHDLNVEQLALGVNSSRAQLYRLFQGQSLSVHGALREARLIKSVEYLRSCGDKVLSIGAIAYACGFSDQSVFSKLFKQRFGVTPSELRNGQAQAAQRIRV